MEIYQCIMIVLITLNIGRSLAIHGQPKQGNYNFWSTLIGSAINIWLLTAGGFFKW